MRKEFLILLQRVNRPRWRRGRRRRKRRRPAPMLPRHNREDRRDKEEKKPPSSARSPAEDPENAGCGKRSRDAREPAPPRARSRLGRSRVNTYWIGDILEFVLPAVDESVSELAADLMIGVFRKTYSARLGQVLEPRRDVDAVAHQVAIGFLDDVAQVNPNSDFDSSVVCQSGVALGQAAQDLLSATHGLDHAAELN